MATESAGGRRSGRLEAHGAIPGSLGLVVFARDADPQTTRLSFDSLGDARATIDLGPEPVPADATFTVYSVDRTAEIIGTVPTRLPR
jgi:hypothetical protein